MYLRSISQVKNNEDTKEEVSKKYKEKKNFLQI